MIKINNTEYDAILNKLIKSIHNIKIKLDKIDIL